MSEYPGWVEYGLERDPVATLPINIRYPLLAAPTLALPVAIKVLWHSRPEFNKSSRLFALEVAEDLHLDLWATVAARTRMQAMLYWTPEPEWPSLKWWSDLTSYKFCPTPTPALSYL